MLLGSVLWELLLTKALLGDAWSRAEVDQCKTPVSSNNTFWDRVQEIYINDEDPLYDDVDCDENHHDAFDDIHPSHIVQHTVTKLKKMWKEVNGCWKKIVAKFNTWGQHDYEFWNFCEGQLDVLYLNTKVAVSLYSCLQSKPNPFLSSSRKTQNPIHFEKGMFNADCFDSMSSSTSSSCLLLDRASSNQLVELTGQKSESAKRPQKRDDSMAGSLALLAASNTQSEMERSGNHLLVQMKVATKQAGKSNRLMILYTKYGDALYELKKKKKKKEETDTAEIEEIDEEIRFLKGKLTKVKKDMDKEAE
jgi:hypothetical protein